MIEFCGFNRDFTFPMFLGFPLYHVNIYTLFLYFFYLSTSVSILSYLHSELLSEFLFLQVIVNPGASKTRLGEAFPTCPIFS